jgi:hypothetical protein
MRRLTWILAACLAVLAGVGEAQADPITYTVSGTASGSLGANPFTNAAVTVTAAADASAIVNHGAGFFDVPSLAATVSVSGLGTATFTVPTRTFTNQPIGGAGIGTSTGINPPDILDTLGNPALTTYDLSTSIGPLTGTPGFNSGTHFATTSGDLVLNSVSGNTTFTAVAAPEPSGLALAGVGLAGWIGYAWRRRRKPDVA